MPVRIVDIANKLNISRGTVDRALHGRGEVSEHMRQTILAAAAEMNYRPNTLARSLKTNKSGLIGVLMPQVVNSFFAEIVQGMSEASSRANKALVFCLTEGQKSVDRYLSLLIEKRVDGAIVTPASGIIFSEQFCQQLIDAKIPVVAATRHTDHPKVPCVMSHNIRGGYLGTQHLLQLGHTKIAFVSFEEGDYLADQRYQGYRKAMLEYGFGPDEQYYVASEKDDYIDVDRILELPCRPTAMFASTDLLAATIIQQLPDKGFSVPGDISVVGFDDLAICSLVKPKITTIRQPKRELGVAAFEYLQKISDGESVEDLVLDVELIVRDSTARLK